MSLTLIVAEIKTVLEGVSGIGIVRDYERSFIDPTDLLNVFGSGGVIKACTIAWDRTGEERLTNEEVLRRHHFTIRRYDALIDPTATETGVFRVVVDAIMTAFRALNDLNSQAELAGPMQLIIAEPRIFFDTIPVHYAEFGYDAQELIST